MCVSLSFRQAHPQLFAFMGCAGLKVRSSAFGLFRCAVSDDSRDCNKDSQQMRQFPQRDHKTSFTGKEIFRHQGKVSSTCLHIMHSFCLHTGFN
jgi:hypothetical protein